jgi:hypothetical protein
MRIIRLFSFHNSLSRTNLRTKSRRNSHRLASKTNRFAFMPASSVVKELRPWAPPRAFRAGRNVRTTSNRNKKPGVERRANPPANRNKRFRAMLDWSLSGIRNRPHFEPKTTPRNIIIPWKSGAGLVDYSSFLESVKRPLQKLARWQRVGFPLCGNRI